MQRASGIWDPALGHRLTTGPARSGFEQPPEPAAFWAQLFIQISTTGGTVPERPNELRE